MAKVAKEAQAAQSAPAAGKFTPTFKTEYKERIVPALMKEFGYKSIMQVPKLEKIVVNQGMGQAVADKKLIDVAIAELTQITGQKAPNPRRTSRTSNCVRECLSVFV